MRVAYLLPAVNGAYNHSRETSPIIRLCLKISSGWQLRLAAKRAWSWLENRHVLLQTSTSRGKAVTGNLDFVMETGRGFATRPRVIRLGLLFIAAALHLALGGDGAGFV